MNYIPQLQAIGIQIPPALHGKEKVKVVCPFCSSERRKSRDKSMTVWVQDGNYNCHHCGRTGSVIEHKSDYQLPKQRTSSISEKTLAYIKSRGISESAVEYYRVTDGVAFFPGAGREMNAIHFNYFLNGHHINTKFRSGAKDFAMVTGAEKTLYAIDTVRESDYMIITEGEFDVLAFYTAGVYMATSVPTGASETNNNLDYLAKITDTHLANKERVYLATDTDAPGLKLRDDLARRIGKERCYIIEYPEGCKDANDVLQTYGDAGVEMLHDAFKNAKAFPVEGLVRFEDAIETIMHYKQVGMPKGDLTGLPSDEVLQWFRGELVTWTGVPNHGKSNAVDEVAVRLARRNNWKFGYFSSEKQMFDIHYMELIQKTYQRSIWKATEYGEAINEEELRRAQQWIDNHFYLLKQDASIEMTVDGMLEKATELVRKYGIDVFVLDNYAYLEKSRDTYTPITEYVSQSLNKVREWCATNRTSFWMVAHPAKMKYDKDGKVLAPGGYDISDSAHFYNKSDVGITIYRAENHVEFQVWKVRQWYAGHIGKAMMKFNPNYGGYYSATEYNTQSVNKLKGQPDVSDEFLQFV